VTKQEMLAAMNEKRWYRDVDEKSSYEKIKEEYDEMMAELSDDSLLFPNGRDFDAENEDGI